MGEWTEAKASTSAAWDDNTGSKTMRDGDKMWESEDRRADVARDTDGGPFASSAKWKKH